MTRMYMKHRFVATERYMQFVKFSYEKIIYWNVLTIDTKDSKEAHKENKELIYAYVIGRVS